MLIHPKHKHVNKIVRLISRARAQAKVGCITTVWCLNAVTTELAQRNAARVTLTDYPRTNQVILWATK